MASAKAAAPDVFLSHDWGTDGENHKRVSRINNLLRNNGVSTWFDEDRMTGNIDLQMTDGIDKAKVVVVFITERYVSKVSSRDGRDNCQKEFMYACNHKSPSNIILVVLEPLHDHDTWTAPLGLNLGPMLHVDMATPAKIEENLTHLCKEIEVRMKPPSAAEEKCSIVPLRGAKVSVASATVANSAGVGVAIDAAPMIYERVCAHRVSICRFFCTYNYYNNAFKCLNGNHKIKLSAKGYCVKTAMGFFIFGLILAGFYVSLSVNFEAGVAIVLFSCNLSFASKAWIASKSQYWVRIDIDPNLHS